MENQFLNRCLSCGAEIKAKNRRYCAIKCRQHLHHRLELRSGLLQALNTRYASFYFTGQLIVLDVLPHDADVIYSFTIRRKEHRKPADTFDQMAEALSQAWWMEKKKTNRNYLARRHVLDKAFANQTAIDLKRPPIIKTPSGVGKSMSQLNINHKHLDTQDLPRVIKHAFRKQAKKYHPDIGGDNELFRQIHLAYEQLIAWSKNPTYQTRSGFPDKWFYDGHRNKWYQPIPAVP